MLLLDEPTSAVDPQSRRDFWDSLFDLVDAGTTILVSTHYMDEAERCHRLAILDHGRLVADGSPQELKDALLAPRCSFPAPCHAAHRPRLAGKDFVVAMAQIGAHLRVLTRGGDDASSQVTNALRNAGIDTTVEPTEPNLEDVFVTATRSRGAMAEKPQ